MLPDPAKNAFHDQKRLLAGVPVRTIFDVGAFVGDITAIYADLFPEATIQAFEPFPENFYALKGRFVGTPRVKPVRSAVANQPGTRQFHVNRDSATNSLLPTARAAADWVTPASAVETLSVLEAPVTTIDDFCHQEGIEEIQILKMDIQGGELLALEGAQELLRRGSIPLIYTEVLFVPLYEGQAYFHDIASFLARYGYTVLDLYDLAYADNAQLRWADALFLSPQLRTIQVHALSEGKQPAVPASVAAAVPACQASSSPSPEAAVQSMWDRSLRHSRPPILQGFVMPGFAGRYYMWPEEYALLGKYVDLTYGDYLEIGSMCGIIAMSFAEKYPHRSFVCVDNFSEGQDTIAGEKQVFLQNLGEHNLQNVVLVEGDSLQVVPTLNRTFDLAFVDGNHSHEYVLNDALNCYRWVRPGGFLAFHDYEHVESTTRAVSDFMQRTGARMVEVVSSLAVVCKCAPDTPVPSDPREQEISSLQQRLEAAHKEVSQFQSQLNASHAETSSLQGTSASVQQENRQLRASLQALETSAGWRLLNRWRRLRDRLAPEGTRRRRWYDSVVKPLRRSG